MARYGRCTLNGMRELQEKLEKFHQEEVDKFIEDCAKELAARLLRKVIHRTPVGQYEKDSGKVGGTLRRGWTTNGDGRNVQQYVNGLRINHFGDTFVIEITNPVEYASYVEYGHRTPDHKKWVQGKFMMTISEKEIRDIAPALLQRRLEERLGEIFH